MRICYGEVHEIIGRNLQLIKELYKSEKKGDKNLLRKKKAKSKVQEVPNQGLRLLVPEVQEFFGELIFLEKDGNFLATLGDL